MGAGAAVDGRSCTVGGRLPCFRLSHLSVALHKVVRIDFHFLISSFADTNDPNFGLFQVFGLREVFWVFGI